MTIDQLAVQVECKRHIPTMNACAYDSGTPCACRILHKSIALKAEGKLYA